MSFCVLSASALTHIRRRNEILLVVLGKEEKQEKAWEFGRVVEKAIREETEF